MTRSSLPLPSSHRRPRSRTSVGSDSASAVGADRVCSAARAVSAETKMLPSTAVDLDESVDGLDDDAYPTTPGNTTHYEDARDVSEYEDAQDDAQDVAADDDEDSLFGGARSPEPPAHKTYAEPQETAAEHDVGAQENGVEIVVKEATPPPASPSPANGRHQRFQQARGGLAATAASRKNRLSKGVSQASASTTESSSSPTRSLPSSPSPSSSNLRKLPMMQRSRSNPNVDGDKTDDDQPQQSEAEDEDDDLRSMGGASISDHSVANRKLDRKASAESISSSTGRTSPSISSSSRRAATKPPLHSPTGISSRKHNGATGADTTTPAAANGRKRGVTQNSPPSKNGKGNNAISDDLDSSGGGARPSNMDEIDELLAEVERMEAEYKAKAAVSEQSLMEKDAIIEALGHQLSEVRRKSSQLEEEKETLRKREIALTKQVELANSAVEELKAEMERLTETFEAKWATMEVERDKAAERAADSVAQEAQRQFAEASHKFAVLQQQCAELHEQVGQRDTQIASLQDELEEAHRQSDSRNITATAEIAQLRADLAAATAEVATNNRRHVSEVQDLMSKLAERDKIVAQAKADSDAAHHSLANVVAEKTRLQQENTELQTVCEELMVLVEGGGGK